MRGAMVASALGLVLLLVPRSSAAQELRASSGVSPPSAGSRVDIGTFRPYWGAAPSRPFAAVTFDTAGIAVRTELDLGIGKPHHEWAGLELTSNLSLRGLSEFLGIRAVTPWANLRFGGRFVSLFSQLLIPEKEVVTRTDLDADEGLKSHYLAVDGEVNFNIPLPVGTLGLGGGAYGLFFIPKGYFVLEENLRTVVAAPFVARGRASYLFGIGDPDTLRIGGVAEVVVNPSRELVNVRVGPAVAVSLTHHFEAVGVAVFSVFNPDEIGLAGADLGQIGLRYRWATGDLWPEFP